MQVATTCVNTLCLFARIMPLDMNESHEDGVRYQLISVEHRAVTHPETREEGLFSGQIERRSTRSAGHDRVRLAGSARPRRGCYFCLGTKLNWPLKALLSPPLPRNCPSNEPCTAATVLPLAFMVMDWMVSVPDWDV